MRALWAARLRQAIFEELGVGQRFDARDIEGVWEALGRDSPEGLDAWLGMENQEEKS